MANIEGLSSLQGLYLNIFSPDQIFLKRLKSLRELWLLCTSFSHSQEHLSNLIECLPNVDSFILSNELSNINLDSLVYLKSFTLLNSTPSGLNTDIFKNIAHQLEKINIWGFVEPISHETIVKLFDGHSFSNLLNLEISMSGIDKFENRLFSGFRMLQTLNLTINEIRIIDNETFSNMKPECL